MGQPAGKCRGRVLPAQGGLARAAAGMAAAALLIVTAACGRPTGGASAVAEGAGAGGEAAMSTEKARAELLRIAAGLPRTAPAVPRKWAGKIRYYTGASTSLYGVLVNGHSHEWSPLKAPPDSVFYDAYHYDRQGRLILIVEYGPGQQPQVTDQIFYADGRPFARSTYTEGELSFTDMVYYYKGQPYLACRIGEDQKLLGLEELHKSWK